MAHEIDSGSCQRQLTVNRSDYTGAPVAVKRKLRCRQHWEHHLDVVHGVIAELGTLCEFGQRDGLQHLALTREALVPGVDQGV